MKGNNELHLNTATVMEAVQQWLDNKMPTSSPTVTHFKSSGKGDGVFVVEVSSDADLPVAPKKA